MGTSLPGTAAAGLELKGTEVGDVRAYELGRAGWSEIAGGGSRKLGLWSEE